MTTSLIIIIFTAINGLTLLLTLALSVRIDRLVKVLKEREASRLECMVQAENKRSVLELYPKEEK